MYKRLKYMAVRTAVAVNTKGNVCINTTMKKIGIKTRS